MLYRNKKKNDMNAGKYIGVGGKQEVDETIEQCAIREVKEETGLTVQSLCFVGTVLFHTPTYHEHMYIYTSTDFIGQIHSCNEGDLHFIPSNQILSLPLWPSDILFLKRILQNQLPFHFIFYYDENNTFLHYEERKAP